MKTSRFIKMLSLALCSVFIASSTGITIEADEVTTEQSVMTEGLASYLSTISNTDKVELVVWQTDIDYSVVEEQTFKKTGLREKDITDDLGMEVIQNYITVKRSCAEVLYNKFNTMFKNQVLSKFSSNAVIYQSKLSPMFITEMTKADALELQKNENVLYMERAYKMSPVDESTLHNTNSGAAYLRDTPSINATGQGVIIGQIEAGIPDVNKTLGTQNYFANNVHVLNDNSTVSDHATLVAAIIAGKAITKNAVVYKGIAPNATLYSKAINENDTSSFYEAVEDLIGVYNVNIINMSCGLSGNGLLDGTYNTPSRWVDHIAYNHDVHFVKSAGGQTDSSSAISTPGMAYNAITVGNVNYTSNDVWGSYAPGDLDDAFMSNCYVAQNSPYENYTDAEKPDISAIGNNVCYGDLNSSGTSFAAAQITGQLAQLCQINTSLLTLNNLAKAILTTAAVYRAANIQGGGADPQIPLTKLYERQGAGISNVRCAYQILVSLKYRNFSLQEGVNSYRYTFNVPSDYNYLRVGLTWIKTNTLTGAHTNSAVNSPDLPNYSLALYRGTPETGELVAYSLGGETTLEMMECENMSSGSYTIAITLNNPNDCSGKQHLAFAWY